MRSSVGWAPAEPAPCGELAVPLAAGMEESHLRAAPVYDSRAVGQLINNLPLSALDLDFGCAVNTQFCNL